MKAVILHGTANNHKGNWFPWLKSELQKRGVEVWVPDLPGAERPNLERYTKFLLSSGWDFSDNLVIGHSAGAVEVLHLLENLSSGTKINTGVMVAVFKGGLGWDVLEDLEGVEFDFSKIRNSAKQLIAVHSDDDPHCPIGGAKEIAKAVGAEFIQMSGMKHFSVNTDPRFTKFPELLDIIDAKVLK